MSVQTLWYIRRSPKSGSAIFAILYIILKVRVYTFVKNFRIKGTRNLSKKRARLARSAGENQRQIINSTISSTEGIYRIELVLY